MVNILVSPIVIAVPAVGVEVTVAVFVIVGVGDAVLVRVGV